LDRQRALELQELRQSLGLTVEKLSDPVGQGIEAEVGDAEDTLRGPKDVAGQHPELHPKSQVHGGKIGGGRHQHHQVFVIWRKWTE